MSSSVHVGNEGKDNLILGEGPTQGLNDTITAEAKYPSNGSNNFLCVNVTKVYQFKAKQKTQKK